ncbi:class I SAM-dependent methyltransferase [bacterium]|nr:class I SAM-dependent methyltransferase [bacterium]
MTNAEFLYDAPDLYRRALGPADEEEIAFYDALLPKVGTVLSLGCGEGRLEAPLSSKSRRFVGLDLSPAMAREAARRDPNGLYVAARMEAPPFSRIRFAAAISGLLSFSYLTRESDLLTALRWLREVLCDGAPVILDVPCAHRPKELQGIEETHTDRELKYTFRYLDAECSNGFGTVLHTQIDVRTLHQNVSRSAPLTVFTPDGLRRLFDQAGLNDLCFFAPHDLETRTSNPPRDCRRAVVLAFTRSD